MLSFVLNRCLDGRVNGRVKSEGETTNLKIGWESFSKFGNPWLHFASFGGKTLGLRTHRFASESPWNDQFSLPTRAKGAMIERGRARCDHVPSNRSFGFQIGPARSIRS